MFLNKLVKHVPDTPSLTTALKTALPVPNSESSGREKMRGFLAFLEDLISSGKVQRKALVPSFTPFFLSAWWHVQDVEKWPIFYVSARQALAAEGLHAPSSDLVEDYFAFRDAHLCIGKRLGLTSWEVERLFIWRQENTIPQETPANGKGNSRKAITNLAELDEDEKEQSEISHEQIQWLLLTMGKSLKCKVWVAANDRNRTWNGNRLGDLCLEKLPSLGLDSETQRIIELIDVIWIRGERQVVAAFEVEHTTSVYSGLLRMSDLVVSAPNLSFPLYIVVPRDRTEKVRTQLSRPTFQWLDLHRRCRFFSDEDLLRNADNVMKWASDPEAIAKMAQQVGDASQAEA